MSASHINDPKHWRDRAEAMRALAEETADANARETMLRVAADYEKLAERAARRASGASAQRSSRAQGPN